MSDQIGNERLREALWAHEHPDEMPYPNEEVFVLDSTEEIQVVRELLALRAAAEGMEKALEAIVREGCQIVTHHRPDCEWCAGLKALAAYRKAVGK